MPGVPGTGDPAAGGRCGRGNEAYLHAEPVAGPTAARPVWVSAAVDPQAAGVLVPDDPADLVTGLVELLGAHRVRDRFPAPTS